MKWVAVHVRTSTARNQTLAMKLDELPEVARQRGWEVGLQSWHGRDVPPREAHPEAMLSFTA
jgi:hypothetical protein